jgi:hypothetical protein
MAAVVAPGAGFFRADAGAECFLARFLFVLTTAFDLFRFAWLLVARRDSTVRAESRVREFNKGRRLRHKNFQKVWSVSGRCPAPLQRLPITANPPGQEYSPQRRFG